MTTTILLLVSRDTWLKKIFACLELLECDARYTNLLVVVDGNASLYVETREHVTNSKFAQTLCVQFPSKTKPRQYGVETRRLRIRDIHDFAQQHIMSAEFIFLIEDDTPVRPDTLTKLYSGYLDYPHAGFLSGVSIGRHGIEHIGCWVADNVYEPIVIKSLLPPENELEVIQKVDAAGFYAMLTRAENYMAFKPEVFENNMLGVDVAYGIALRQQGYDNFVRWDVRLEHLAPHKKINFMNARLVTITFTKGERGWKQLIS